MSVRLDQLRASMEIEESAFERSEHDAAEWQKILQLPIKLPGGGVVYLRDLEANFIVCRDDCYPQDLTLANIVLLIENDPSFLHYKGSPRLSFADTETIKQELIDKIIECIDAGEGDFAIKNRRKALSFYPPERLREELRNAQARENLRQKPTSELRQIVRAGRSAPGLPELPRKIMIHGEMVKLDADRIKSLDREPLKTLIRKYGADQINARLRGE